MKFSIRDVLLVTAVIATAEGWWVDRSALQERACKAEAFQRLSERLAEQLKDKNPKSNFEIRVDGHTVTYRYGRSTPSSP